VGQRGLFSHLQKNVLEFGLFVVEQLQEAARQGRKAVSEVAVAQLVESRIVIPVVVGSSPISHPKNSLENSRLERLFSFLPSANF
jgi:hypothetical protein